MQDHFGRVTKGVATTDVAQPERTRTTLLNTPQDLILVDTLGDAFKSSRMERMLRNLTASYKLYWLRGVFDEAVLGEGVVPMRCVAARMVAQAWYTVVYFRLSLGATDQLARAVNRAREVCDLRDDASEPQVLSAVISSKDMQLQQMLKDLCKYVPYRLIQPFYAGRLAAQRKALDMGTHRFDAQVNRLVIEYNGQDPAGARTRSLRVEKRFG